MTDFDFEELDKAVTGALAPPIPANEGGVSSDDNTIQRDVDVPERPVALAMRRSSGRFMDMVHPGSAMRPGQSAGVPPRPTPQPTAAPTTVAPTPPSYAAAPAVSSAAPSETLPPAPQPVPGVEPASSEAQAPLESPFLPGAVVEKRPLGGAEPSPLEQEVNQSTAESVHTASSDHLLEAPDEPRITAQSEVAPEALQPFAQSPKKKSGVGVFLLIIALIIIGAGVGLGFYFYVLPLL